MFPSYLYEPPQLCAKCLKFYGLRNKISLDLFREANFWAKDQESHVDRQCLLELVGEEDNEGGCR